MAVPRHSTEPWNIQLRARLLHSPSLHPSWEFRHPPEVWSLRLRPGASVAYLCGAEQALPALFSPPTPTHAAGIH
ncbi:hypothetical protein BD309DRAFT_956122, partial [Dichomitus squalens]